MTRPPRWTDPLLPDAPARRRIRAAVGLAAAEVLSRRPDDWWEVASRWAGVLAPLGIAATLAFMALAVDGGVAPDRPVRHAEASRGDDVFESLRRETAPVGFGERAPDDADVVFAAIGAVDRYGTASP